MTQTFPCNPGEFQGQGLRSDPRNRCFKEPGTRPWTSDGPPAASPRLVWPQTWHNALSHGQRPTPAVAMVTELQYLCKAGVFFLPRTEDRVPACEASMLSHPQTMRTEVVSVSLLDEAGPPLERIRPHHGRSSYNEVILTPRCWALQAWQPNNTGH